MLYEQQCQFDPTCLTLSPSAARMTPCASVIAVRYESIYIVVCTLPQVQSIIVFSIRFCIIIGNLKYTYTSGMSLDRWSRSLSSFVVWAGCPLHVQVPSPRACTILP